jgi:hypothetical protein
MAGCCCMHAPSCSHGSLLKYRFLIDPGMNGARWPPARARRSRQAVTSSRCAMTLSVRSLQASGMPGPGEGKGAKSPVACAVSAQELRKGRGGWSVGSRGSCRSATNHHASRLRGNGSERACQLIEEAAAEQCVFSGVEASCPLFVGRNTHTLLIY